MDRMLFTGGTGFLGRNIKPLLDSQYIVTTCGISQDDMIRADLAREIPELDGHYDVVLHACGLAHLVPKSEAEKQAFYDVNYQGTVNLCSALERVGVPKALVFISTVAVYGCDSGEMITEEHPLDGYTAYAKSKIMAEAHLTEWCNAKHVILGILRPALFVGRNAVGNLGAMVNGIRQGFYVNIAGGKAAKSFLMAEDIVRILPAVMRKGGIYNICDSQHPTYKQISQCMARQLGKRKPLNIPYWIARMLATAGDCMGKKAPINTYKLEKMVNTLTFSSEKARRELGWEPLNVLENLVV